MAKNPENEIMKENPFENKFKKRQSLKDSWNLGDSD